VSDDNKFLARWSQRKREAKLKEAEAAPEPVAKEQAPDEEPFDLSSLPDIESLTPETDISLFMQKGVPEALRNEALRKMWVLDPAIRNYVGEALDYAWDWNTPGGVPGSGGEITQSALDFASSLFSNISSHENVKPEVSKAEVELSLDQDEAPKAVSIPVLSPGGAEEQGSTAAQHEHHLVEDQDTYTPKKARHGGALPRTSTIS
jgi:Protein of unknown function (DUF3306)